MTGRVCIALIVAALAGATAAPTAAGDEPTGGYGGRQKFVPWKMGLEGANTTDGFVISRVYAGYAANRLGRDRNFTLEAGDRITEVNGRPINRDWTLQKALGYSGGKIDFKYWDDRKGGFGSWRGVTLSR